MNKVDEIFGNKLSSYTKEPSLKAWDKLKSELDKKEEKKAVWWYYVAASLAFLVASYIGFNSLFNNQVENGIIKHANLEKLNHKPYRETISPRSGKQRLASVSPRNIQKPSLVGTLPQNKLQTNETVRNDKKANLRDLNNLIRKTEENNLKNEEETERVALNENKKSSQSAEVISVEASAYMTLEPITIVIKRSNTSIVQQEDTTEKASFRNRLGKVYTQVMNLKNGEKVELKELGIKSDLLAFNKRDKQTQNK